MEIKTLIDGLGWIGTAALLLAFFMVSTKRTQRDTNLYQGDTNLYQGLNLLGSGLLIVNSFYYGAFPSVGVNIAWIVIAIFSLLRRRSDVR